MGSRRRTVSGAQSSGSAKSLLLSLLDQRDENVSAAAFRQFGRDGQTLLRMGLLIGAGHELATVSDDHEDGLIDLIWSPEHNKHGYFSATAGWVSVDTAMIATYRVDVEAALRALFGDALSSKAPIRPLEAGLAFDLGDIRVPGRRHRVPILFARCVRMPDRWQAVRDLLLAKPATRQRLVLTASGRDRLPTDVPSGNTLVSIHDVLNVDGGFVIDAEMLSVRLREVSAIRQSEGPLSVVAEGRVVRLHGKEFRFPRGQKQRAIIRYLWACYHDGRVVVDVEEVSENCDLSRGARIRDHFKRDRVMSELLFEAGGTCGFRLDDPK